MLSRFLEYFDAHERRLVLQSIVIGVVVWAVVYLLKFLVHEVGHFVLHQLEIQPLFLLIPMMLLAISLCVYLSLERSYTKLVTDDTALRTRGNATGGNPFAGFTAVLTSRYLFAISVFGFFLATCGTTIYFQQSEIVKAAFDSDETKLRYFADVNFFVSVLTLVFQFFVAGFLMRTIGIGPTLAMLPVAYILGITSLALSPDITVLAVISVTGRAAEYGISNPAREVLYTSVDREDRYKAKSFIDTVVRRGGDTMIGSLYGHLRESLGVGLATMSWLAYNRSISALTVA